MLRSLLKYFLAALTLALVGCFGSPGISLSDGKFNIKPPPSINGVGQHTNKNSLKRFTGSVSYGTSGHFQGRIHNDSQKAGANNKTTLPEMDGSIEYKVQSLNYLFEYQQISTSTHDFKYGPILGLYPYPFLSVFISNNRQFLEIGGYVLASLSFEKMDYAGTAVDAPSTYKDAWMGDYYPKNVQRTNVRDLHGNLATGLFLNFFVKDFTVSYIPSIYFPRLFFGGIYDYNTTFFFPLLIMQELQLAYNYANWSFGTSVTNIVSDNLSGTYWKFGLNISYYK